MIKIKKVVLLIMYLSVLSQFLRVMLFVQHEDIIELNYITRQSGNLKMMKRAIKQLKKNETVMTLDFKIPVKWPTDLKFILRWTDALTLYSSSVFRNGQQAFINNKCDYFNCFITKDKSLLLDYRNFDAILFDVENTWDAYPIVRSPHQKYIFTASEPAGVYAICHPIFDTYYNLTWTYKIDSDIRYTYVAIYDKSGNVVGPKVNMTWIESMLPTPRSVKMRLSGKNATAAWFVSHCDPKSGRMLAAQKLGIALEKYGLHIDIYGWCGNMTCPRDRMDICLDQLEKRYYFYLAFENSVCEDYVTEKILYPLQHFTVPIVYGGADYSRFLPPGSYINAKELTAESVAFLINKAITNKDVYENYFRWHNYYVYKENAKEPDICTLCRKLQSNEETVKYNFRTWWNRDFNNKCLSEKIEMMFVY